MLQGSVLFREPHGSPPCSGWMTTILLYVIPPPPQVALQTEVEIHSLSLQSTGVGGWYIMVV